jgi:hypothetical protein
MLLTLDRKQLMNIMEEESYERMQKRRRVDDSLSEEASSRREKLSEMMPPFHRPTVHTTSDRSERGSVVGMNAGVNASMFASLSGQSPPRLASGHLDPVLASPSLTSGILQQWSRDPRIHQVPYLSLLVPNSNYPSSFVDHQDHLTLLRLNALQGNALLMDNHSRLAMAQSGPSLLMQSQLSGNVGPGLASFGASSLRRTGFRGNEIPASSPGMSLPNPGPTGSLDTTWTQRPNGAGREPITANTKVVSLQVLLPLPKNDEGPILHFTQRVCVSLSTDEDQNWLSEFLCFVRSDLVEIFRANQDDVRSRNSSKKVLHGQVGIRCRFCSHLRARASRSSSYPSSLSRIYQSLTMMLRDHFGVCNAIPAAQKQQFLELKGKTSQGATDSKHYWVCSANKMGLVDSESGIWVSDNPEPSGNSASPFGTAPVEKSESGDSSSRPILLVSPEDRIIVSDFLYTLMSHAQLVHMEESERIGNRKSLPIGLPDIGCRHCCQSNRKGLCRLFPNSRRNLASKVNDLYEHIRRCTLCPFEVKVHLALLRRLEASKHEKPVGEKEFFDRIWSRIETNIED